jgi:hypothetical protein
MLIKNIAEKVPHAGYFTICNDDGEFRILDSNGRRYRMRPESGTPTHAAKATGTLTGTTIAADDTVTIGATVYTFVAALTDPDVPFEVLVGASDSESLDNLIAAINGAAGAGTTYGTGTTAHLSVTAAAGAGDTMVVTAEDFGSNGNSIATTATLTSGDWAAAALAGGSLATEASKGDQLIDGSYLYTATANVSITSTSGWEKSAVAAL